MPRATHRSQSFSASAWILACLIPLLTSCAKAPIATVATPPVRVCPAPALYSELTVPPFEGQTWSDLAAYAKGLQYHIHSLNQDRDAIRGFCDAR